MIISVFDRVENILGSHNVLKSLFSPNTSKDVIVWEWVKLNFCMTNKIFDRTNIQMLNDEVLK